MVALVMASRPKVVVLRPARRVRLWGGCMGSRAIVGAGSGVTAVLAAAIAIANGRLDAGWPWWVAYAVLVLASATVTGFLAWRAAGPTQSPPAQPGPGAVRSADGSIENTRTRVTGLPTDSNPAYGGAGSISAGKDIKNANTNVSFGPNPHP
jgi:hypothetical protein